MTLHAAMPRRPDLRAPRGDGEALVAPPLDEVGALLTDNARDLARHGYDVQGMPLARLARAAREEMIREARHWTAAYRDIGLAELDATGPILLAGHQPELFHPGVWFKNFALSALARRHGAMPINLLIDSDTLKSAALRVPGGTVDEPHATSIPLDRAAPALPYEERRILDREMLADFADRVIEHIGPLVPDPLIHRFWPMVRCRARQYDRLGACMAQARHELEGEWGLATLEVPQSRLCDTESFAWLVVHLLAHLPRFWDLYNDTVRQYRHAHRIRSASHPVPDLAAAEGWLESPFWVWTAEEPERRPLWARQRGEEVVLTDGRRLEWTLPLSADAEGLRAVERLQALSAHGVKIRSRALITTLWARLALGDLFLHGIGGAKYDQVTDALIERFFGLAAPRFMVLSATVRLPIPRPPRTLSDPAEIRRTARDLRFHPERHLPADALDARGAELIAHKRRWIQTPVTPASARERFLEIRQANDALQPYVAPERERLEVRHAEIMRALHAESILGWREYSFCLYPEDELRETLFRMVE